MKTTKKYANTNDENPCKEYLLDLKKASHLVQKNKAKSKLVCFHIITSVLGYENISAN